MAILFNLKVFDGSITGVLATDNQYSPAELNGKLAQAEKFYVYVRTAQGAGTSPTIAVTIEHSNDNVNFSTKSTPIAATAIPPNAVGGMTGSDTGTVVGGAYHRIKIALGGTNPSANVQVWVTGRSND